MSREAPPEEETPPEGSPAPEAEKPPQAPPASSPPTDPYEARFAALESSVSAFLGAAHLTHTDLADLLDELDDIDDDDLTDRGHTEVETEEEADATEKPPEPRKKRYAGALW